MCVQVFLSICNIRKANGKNGDDETNVQKNIQPHSRKLIRMEESALKK